MTFDQHLARPGQSLEAHLDGVVENAEDLVPADATTPDGQSLQTLVATAAHLHDIGKLTPAFQAYIRERPDRSPRQDETHADVGAVLTFHALVEQDFSKRACAAGFYAVLKHHGAIPNVQSAHSNWATKDTRYALIEDKLTAIDDTAQSEAADRLSRASTGSLKWADVRSISASAYRASLDRVTFDASFYPLLLRVWSTITCADKFDAADLTIEEATKRPDPDKIGFDTDATGIERELNTLRTQARADVVERLSDHSSETGVYTLTLPTGFGKTFAGLEAGLRTAQNCDGRVVYALPYTTILDQVHGDILKQFEVSSLDQAYTLHHHLADTRKRLKDGDERVTKRSEALHGESWRSGLILTTFVQLFESLAGPGNIQSMKLPALQDAVVIVDEPQVLQPEWWQLVARLATVLTEDYDAMVVLMTATQPQFIATSDFEVEPAELVPDTQTYFGFLEEHERVRFHLDSSLPLGDRGSPRSIHEASEQIVERTLAEGGATLAVNNTVAAAARMGDIVATTLEHRSEPAIDLGACLSRYLSQGEQSVLEAALDDDRLSAVVDDVLELLRDARTSETTPTLAVTLSAALRPCDRGVLVETLKRVLRESIPGLDDLPVIVSSTQLVEAGVDISVDRVYRDYAPLPSVVQAAGRCNRSFGGETGRVTLWRLRNTVFDREPANIVYRQSRDRLTPTITALQRTAGKGQDTIPETEMLTTAVDAYYDTLHGADHRSSRADGLVQAYDHARGEDLRLESMIEETTADILVVRTDADVAVLRSYLDARSQGKYADAQAKLQVLKHLFASASPERVAEVDMRTQITSELGFTDIDIEEFGVVDDRRTDYYDLSSGRGIRASEE